jgi:hypothetical protein
MSKSDYLENGLLNLIFNGASIPGIADNAAAGPITTFYWALHTADPAEMGMQSTNEASFGGYTRLPVSRDTLGMSAADAGSVFLVNSLTWPVATSPDLSRPQILTHFSIGIAETGAEHILYTGTLDPSISVSAGKQVVLTTGSYVIED